jgi:hypothetical protein
MENDMNKLMFKVAEKISYELDKMAMYIVKDGLEYESHKTLFNVLDKMSTSIYNTGYNKCVIGQNKG